MKIAEVMPRLEQLIRRLNAASSADDVPEEAREQIQAEIRALDSVVSYIKGDMTRTVIVIGHSSYVNPLVEEISKLKKSLVTEAGDDEYSQVKYIGNLSVVLIKSPTDGIFEKYMERYNPDAQEGNKLTQKILPDHMVCNRFYCAMDDEGKKVALFNLSIQNDYLSATSDLIEWAMKVFEKLTWGG